MTVLTEDQVRQRLMGSKWMLAETKADAGDARSAEAGGAAGASRPGAAGSAIVREYKLADFAQAIAFVNRVAALAEEANHHPDILVHGWNKVRLELSTHSAGGLTEADFALAQQIDRVD